MPRPFTPLQIPLFWADSLNQEAVDEIEVAPQIAFLHDCHLVRFHNSPKTRELLDWKS
jgi:hypothetical protein